MKNDDWDDEDSWTDEDDDELHEEDSASCPECGGTVYSVTDKCPKCGYWLTDDDRRSMGSGMSKPFWLRVTAVILLAAFLFTLLAVGFTLF
jgi:hypothetical protein